MYLWIKTEKNLYINN